MAASSGLFLATIYNKSQLAERKHVARYWLINTAATVVPLSAHPSPLVIQRSYRRSYVEGRCTEEVFCRPSTAPVVMPHDVIKMCSYLSVFLCLIRYFLTLQIFVANVRFLKRVFCLIREYVMGISPECVCAISYVILVSSVGAHMPDYRCSANHTTSSIGVCRRG